MNVKLVISFLMEDNIFSFKLVCNTKNIKFRDFSYIKTVEIAFSISTDKYL